MSKALNPMDGLPVIHDRAAGIDIGSRFHVVAVPTTLANGPVQTFQAFTADTQRMADWLKSVDVSLWRNLWPCMVPIRNALMNVTNKLGRHL